ncbi:protein of unknown function [Desulfatibacillum alkenivorans DSM 16219]|uniref:DUF748 domain-containing protein n=1 Tax=Desulfatibacillum alkenivorans DSM 16219 TaxID=1121393 RepID=A0A1M6S3N3_9BACT|nr:DUF748 domain-containing protein [Desulfatibacillum alkenivorans]SHK39286.1 protein of unknown function [Desulfatibacillum alkenivorans DSM 16219]
MNPIARWKQLSRLKKIFIIILGLVTAYTIIGFVLIPALIKWGVVRTIEKDYGRKASIEDVAFNPYGLTLRVDGFTILDPDETAFVSFGGLSVDVKVWDSITSMAAVVGEVDLENPLVRVTMNEDGAFNFADLIPASNPEANAPEENNEEQEKKPPRFSLDILSVSGGNIVFVDKQKDATHKIIDLFVAVRGVSGLPGDLDKPVEINLEASINGAPLTVEAESLIFDPNLKSSAGVSFRDISAAPYKAYIPAIEGRTLVTAKTQVYAAIQYSMEESGAHNLAVRNLKVSDTLLAWKDSFNDPEQPEIRGPYQISLGKFSLGMDVLVKDPAAADVLVKDADASLDNLQLFAQNGALKLAGVEHFDVQDAKADMAALKASVGAVNTNGGWFAAALEPSKRINITRMIELSAKEAVEEIAAAASEAAPKEVRQDVHVDASEPPAEEVKEDAAAQTAVAEAPQEPVREDAPDQAPATEPVPAPELAKQGPVWTAELAALNLDDYNFTFKDLSMADPVSLEVAGMSVKVRDFSTAPGAKTGVSFLMNVNERGVISGTGEISLDPIASELEVHCQNTGLVFLTPYLQEYVDALLKGADFTLKGKTTFAMQDDVPRATFQGDVMVSGFDFETRKESNLADWDVLSVKGISVQTEPLSASVEEIHLKDLKSWVILEEDGSINYANLMKKPEDVAQDMAAAETEEAQEASPSEDDAQPLELPDIQVKRIVLENGVVYFQDRSIKPRFTTQLDALNGTITTISSNPDAKATIEMTGKLDNHAPLNITGWAKPLTIPPSGKVVFGFKNIEMAPLSPYTAKYIGYRLSKGKLTLAHEYLYQGGLIDGDNLIVIDQLTLGEKVDSPDAIKAPIELALALLKDPQGRIELPVPVSGDPSNPEFKLGKVISKALANVIIKVITSPFAALGALVGGGEELAFVEYQPGSTALSPDELDKLDKLAKALQERPLLKLDIQGLTNPDADREALTQARYTALLASVKKASMGKAGQDTPLDQIQIADEEREEIVWKAYKDAEFEKEKTALGLVKKIEVPDMEAMLIKSVTPSDEELVQMAWQRAQAAKDVLLNEMQIDPARVFIVEPPALDGLDDKTSLCRAEFSLK